jgi:2-polyprenyl-3-methyl-5-hydroxy-6-metoxy-1,4-benzoquinol methylase
MTPAAIDVEARARLSLGSSHERIHRVVADTLAARGAGGVLADVGCGSGALWSLLRGRFSTCVGVDVVRYGGLPEDVEFHHADLDAGLPLGDGVVDAAVAVEVIEHLENPRAFVRELARIVRPGGWVAISTPNQVSVLSLMTLVLKGSFSAFQERDYPAHRTALLEIDLRRIFTEAGLRDVETVFTRHGRVPFSGLHYPRAVAALAPRRFSDNVVAVGRR